MQVDVSTAPLVPDEHTNHVIKPDTMQVDVNTACSLMSPRTHQAHHQTVNVIQLNTEDLPERFSLPRSCTTLNLAPVQMMTGA